MNKYDHVIIDDAAPVAEPEAPQGARMTPLGRRVLANQTANAARVERPVDDFGYPSADEPESAPVTTTEPEVPKVVPIFNVGNKYTIAPPTEEGKPPPVVRKINNKFARRILRKRGNESRVGREVREGWAQRKYARSVVDNSHEAARLLDAQREYQRAKKAAGES